MILLTPTFEEYVTHIARDEEREGKRRKGRGRGRGREGTRINLTENKLTRFMGDSVAKVFVVV